MTAVERGADRVDVAHAGQGAGIGSCRAAAFMVVAELCRRDDGRGLFQDAADDVIRLLRAERAARPFGLYTRRSAAATWTEPWRT
ncbi:hypothetical protein IU427_26455 [Nocardia beijingensis]|nr:hypothetical protein [Nocardia beijingensis]